MTPLRGRRVLLTGHSGFKGAWMSVWLKRLGAEVMGLSLDPPSEPCLSGLIELDRRLDRAVRVDVRDAEATRDAVVDFAPEVVFHLAAQSLVRRSYEQPKETFDVNVGGTVNVLEAVREAGSVLACVVVTSDKCYLNHGHPCGEDDPLGGRDPYSSSKAAQDITAQAYGRAFLPGKVATARAGNVIGGGDYADDRLFPDLVRALESDEPVRLRNPLAVRPWQHVLEPLSGYLQLAGGLLGDEGADFARAWNFGPREDDQGMTVRDIVREAIDVLGSGSYVETPEERAPFEEPTLRLDSSRAHSDLRWIPRWTVRRAVRATMEWHAQEDRSPDALHAAVERTIGEYEKDEA
jgi:CDP-glucose 4,6-dehydratase